MDIEGCLVPYERILSVEITRDGRSITKTNRSSQLGGAIVGGLLAGGVGAIIGGLSGETEHFESVCSLDLRIVNDDIKDPSLTLSFFSSPQGVDKGDETFKHS